MTSTLRDDSSHFSAVATVNGRVRSPVIIYRADDLDTPHSVHDLNLARADEREKCLGEFTEHERAEVDALLKRLAAQVAAARASAPSGGRGEAPADAFPALEPWDRPVDGAALLDALVDFIPRYVVLPPHAVEAVALWLLHTYLLEAADYTPYLLITSPVRECGKTSALELTEHLAYRAKRTGGITAAALYRTIEAHSPTMLLDELDTRLRGDGGETLRGVLNEGFKRGGVITICVGDDHEPKAFKVFCPKVLAGIGRVWDTVTSRSIPIRMQRASKDEIRHLRKIRGDRIDGICEPYRRQLKRWADDHLEDVREMDAETPEELGARQSDVWRQLFAIADVAGGEWPARARAAAVALHGVAEEEGDYGLLMLEDVRALFDSDGTNTKRNGRVLPTATLMEHLLKMDNRPWPEYHHGKAISSRGVASLLGRFGIKVGSIRLDSDTVARGYRLADCEDAFTRYLSQTGDVTDQPETPGESVTGSVTAQAYVTQQDTKDVTLVTDNAGGMGATYSPDEILAGIAAENAARASR